MANDRLVVAALKATLNGIDPYNSYLLFGWGQVGKPAEPKLAVNLGLLCGESPPANSKSNPIESTNQ